MTEPDAKLVRFDVLQFGSDMVDGLVPGDLSPVGVRSAIAQHRSCETFGVVENFMSSAATPTEKAAAIGVIRITLDSNELVVAHGYLHPA